MNRIISRTIFIISLCFIFTNFVYGNSGIISTSKETIPDFSAIPTITSKKSGDWFDPSSWNENRVPGTNDVVKIEEGHAIHYNGANDAALAVLGIEGTLSVNTFINTRIKVGTILIYRQGKLDIGLVSNPVAPNVKAEVIIANYPLATLAPDTITGSYDPLQFGTGIIALGEVNMHGKEMALTWIKLAQEPRVGENTLTLEKIPYGWSIGDKLVLPDTRQTPLEHKTQKAPVTPINLQLEELTITNISGNKITLSQPLSHDHLGGRDGDGNIVGMPHVGNLTRNIVIRSEDSSGIRGHALFTERAKVDIRYVAFVEMGRTTADPLDNTIIKNDIVEHIGLNQIGRYPIHMHHLMGPVNDENIGYQFVLKGNSVEDGAKWGIAVHNSHFGLIDSNVVYDIEGASIITEEGNEKENQFINNFAVKVGNMITSKYSPRYGGVAGIGRPLGFADFGYEGSAFWFTGNDDYVTDNVAANAAFAGVMYNARSKGYVNNHPLVPNFRGADINDKTQWTSYRKKWAPKIRLSKNNEVYASGVGLWVSFAGIVGNISDYLIWNIKQTGIYSQRNFSASYDNITIISDQSISNLNYIGTFNKGVNISNAHYLSGHMVFNNLHVEGFNLGVDLPAFVLEPGSKRGVTKPNLTYIKNSYFRNFVNVRDHSPTVSTKYTVLDNVEFIQNDGLPNKYLSMSSANIITILEGSNWISRRNNTSRLYVQAYNKNLGDDFEFFFYEQSPDFIMEDVASKNNKNHDNCPTIGLTNQQCWDKYGVATLNKIANCSDSSRSEIHGFACAIQSAPEFNNMVEFNKILADIFEARY